VISVRNIVVLCVIVVCALNPHTADADDRSELASYFDAQVANWSAIRTMDVMCRTALIQEPGIERGVTGTTYERLLFDSVNDRYTYLKIVENRLMGDNDDEPVMSSYSGFVLKDGMYRTFETGKRQLTAKPAANREQVFDEHKMPDWRIIMLMKMSRGSSRTWTGKNFNAMQVLPQQAVSVKKIAPARDGVGFESFSANDAGTRYFFRDEDLMPSKSVWLFKDDSGNVMEVGAERYQWEQVNKIFVPDTVQGTFRDRQFRLAPEELAKLDLDKMSPADISTLYIDVSAHRDMQFKWFDVNGDLNDDLFDFALVDEPAKFIALCDPSLLDETDSKK
jgi:hypothetical protein